MVPIKQHAPSPRLFPKPVPLPRPAPSRSILELLPIDGEVIAEQPAFHAPALFQLDDLISLLDEVKEEEQQPPIPPSPPRNSHKVDEETRNDVQQEEKIEEHAPSNTSSEEEEEEMKPARAAPKHFTFDVEPPPKKKQPKPQRTSLLAHVRNTLLSPSASPSTSPTHQQQQQGFFRTRSPTHHNFLSPRHTKTPPPATNNHVSGKTHTSMKTNTTTGAATTTNHMDKLVTSVKVRFGKLHKRASNLATSPKRTGQRPTTPRMVEAADHEEVHEEVYEYIEDNEEEYYDRDDGSTSTSPRGKLVMVGRLSQRLSGFSELDDDEDVRNMDEVIRPFIDRMQQEIESRPTTPTANVAQGAINWSEMSNSDEWL